VDEADAAAIEDLAVGIVGIDDHEPGRIVGKMPLDQRQRAFADRAETDHHNGAIDAGVNGPIGHLQTTPIGRRDAARAPSRR
jgi:hypothetical protein